jgi:hypothetical protein
MTDSDFLYAFAFRGLVTKSALDSAGGSDVQAANDPEVDIAATVSLSLLDVIRVSQARRMSVVYAAIAAFENSVRQLIENVLLETHGADWWKLGASEKIRTKAESRMAEEDKFRWHKARGEGPLHYTDFGELASIIRQNWPLFEAHVRSLEWTESVFDVLERSRNVIMHSGVLAKTDIERVGINIRDWIAQVGA